MKVSRSSRPKRTEAGGRRLFTPGWIVGLAFIAALAIVGSILRLSDQSGEPPPSADYAGSQSCVECHEESFRQWMGSDHERAMALADPSNVLGDFDDRTFDYYGVTSRMFRDGEKYKVTTDGPSGELETFEIEYTFGVRPLQQYLVEFDDGRVQTLPVAWDTEEERWFHLYPDEKIEAGDWLHWTGVGQKWNYMCADCHSTNLEKNYDRATRTYSTTFSEINVSCEACHGPGSRHIEIARGGRRRSGGGLVDLKSKDSHVQIETCAKCHALRHEIYPGHRPGAPFLDHYFPELLDSEVYQVDGQVLGEDYVYGSFLQSRMYHEGVRCTDCHDPHTARLKIEGNRLCGQCHEPQVYDAPVHHRHNADSPGARCVECHMPERTYMEVDPRRDHSIRIPRPDLSVALGVSNACTQCHEDESAPWAAEHVEQWFGSREDGPRHFAYAIAAGREGKPEGETQLLEIVSRSDEPAMVRASALTLLARYDSDASLKAARGALTDPSGLVRASALRYLERLEETARIAAVAPLLDDPLRAVRAEAGIILAGASRETLSEEQAAQLEHALAEWVAGQMAVIDDWTANHNMGNLWTELGDPAQAEAYYRESIRIQPEFAPARQNLAMLLNRQGRQADAERELRELIRVAPDFADGRYSLGLLLAEDANRLESAAVHLREAVRLAPERSRIRYNHGLALQGLGQPVQAEAEFRRALELDPETPNYLYALAVLYMQNGRPEAARPIVERLLEIDPNDRRIQILAERLGTE